MVRSIEMFYEFFFRFVGYFVQALNPILMVASRLAGSNAGKIPMHMLRFAMRCRASGPEKQSYIHSQGDLHTLDRVEDDYSQLFVEHIKFDDFSQIGSILELIKYNSLVHSVCVFFYSSLPVGVGISAESVITDSLKTFGRFGNIRNDHSPTVEKGYLVGDRLEWLSVGNSHLRKKYDRPVHFRAEGSAVLRKH